MVEKILLIEHHENLGDDLATTHLKESGFEVELVCPFKGDKLQDIDGSICGAVIFGGAQNVTELDKFPFLQTEIDWINSAIDANLPLLGICLGAQLIAHALGADVGPHEEGLCEFGYYEIASAEVNPDFIPESMYVVQAHCQRFEVPAGAKKLASGTTFPNQAFVYNDNVFALQFHPEVTMNIFKRWQDADWAFFDLPGAQSREEQDRLITFTDSMQNTWFKSFLEKLFGAARDNPPTQFQSR